VLRRRELLDEIARLTQDALSSVVYRATRSGLKPDTSSTSGGRWMPPGRAPVLYTCTNRDGACAEITYRQLLLDPVPTK